MTERSFYQTLRKHLQPKGVHLQRIETSLVQGVPDVNFCYQGVEGWIELKSIGHRTGSGVFKVAHLRPSQYAWIKRRCRAGGLVWLLVKAGQDLVLVHGSRISLIYRHEWPWDQVDKFAHVLSAPVDYDVLLAVLTNRHVVNDD